MTPPPAWLQPFLWPASLGFAGAAKARGALYDSGLWAQIDVGIPVASVGNVTAGGTGKTPIVESLVRGLLHRGRRPAIVSRGYGGRQKHPARVPADPAAASAAAQFGDEPAWLARALPECPVYVGRDRVAAARLALADAAPPDVIVADDAFQHRRLARRLDIAIVDATEPLWHYRPLPWGRAREPLAALARAQAVILNKVNLVNPEALRSLRDRLRPILGSTRLVECSYGIRHLADADGRERPVAEARGLRAFCATGIGRPEAFRETLRLGGEIVVAGFLDFADHRRFDEADFARIEREAARVGADAILVTEKDAVKMAGWRPALPLRITRLTAEPAAGWGSFHDEIDRLLS